MCLTFRLQSQCSQFFDLLCRLLEFLTGNHNAYPALVSLCLYTARFRFYLNCNKSISFHLKACEMHYLIPIEGFHSCDQ